MNIFSEETKVYLISGHYGSGKTEISVNLALHIKQNTPQSVTIADLDIINPYFRSRERKDLLAKEGIHLIGGSIEDSLSGVPALSGEVQAKLASRDGFLILDTGGDPEGIRLLGRYREELEQLRKDKILTHYFIYNGYRPEISEISKAEAMLRNIERGATVPVDRLICNSHLLKATGPEEIWAGWRKTEQLSQLTGIPIASCTVPEWTTAPETIPEEMIFSLSLFMRSDWMS